MPTFSLSKFLPLLLAFCLLPCLFMGRAGAVSLTVSPASFPGAHNLAPVTFSLTGVGTAWTGATVFTITGDSHVSKTSQTVTDATHATLVCAVSGAGNGGITLTISDGTSSATTQEAQAEFYVTPSGVKTSSSTVLTFTGFNTIYTQDHPVYTLTGTALAGSSLSGWSYPSDTTATATLTTGATVGDVVLTDPTDTYVPSSCAVPVGQKQTISFATNAAPTVLPASGMITWLRAGTGCYTDTGTTRATATGDAVYTWKDLSGNGNNATQTVAGNRPLLLHNGYNGQDAVQFSSDVTAAATNGMSFPAAVSRAAGQPYTIVMIAVPKGADGERCLLGGSTNNNIWWIGPRNTQAGTFYNLWSSGYAGVGTVASLAGSTNTAQNPYGTEFGLNLQLITVRCDGTTTTADVNGQFQKSFATTNEPAQMYLGNNVGKGYAGSSDLCELVIYNRVLTNTEFLSVQQYFAQQYGLGPNVVTEGNSITAGSTATPTGSYPSRLAALVGGNSYVWNAGYGGNWMYQINGRAAAVDSMLMANRLNILVFQEGTNELSKQGASLNGALNTAGVNVTYAKEVAYMKARQAAGWKVVLWSMIPAATSASPVNTQALNALFRANWPAYADTFVDVEQNDPIMGNPTAFGSLLYQSGDILHPSEGGYKLLAADIAPGVQTVIARAQNAPGTKRRIQ